MPTEPDLQPVDRYADLKAFVAEWHRPIEPGDGNTEAEIAEAEARLGFRLPEALRELYALIGRADDITRGHNRLVYLRDLDVEDDWLVVWEENQCVSLFAVKTTDFVFADPLVWILTDGETYPQDKPFSVAQTALEMLAYEVMMASDWLTIDITQQGAIHILDAEPYLRQRAKPTPYVVLNNSGYYYLDEVLLYSPGSLEEQIAAKTRNDLIAVMGRYEGMCWSYTSLDDE